MKNREGSQVTGISGPAFGLADLTTALRGAWHCFFEFPPRLGSWGSGVRPEGRFPPGRSQQQPGYWGGHLECPCAPKSQKGGLCLDLQLLCALASAKASFISSQNSL